MGTERYFYEGRQRTKQTERQPNSGRFDKLTGRDQALVDDHRKGLITALEKDQAYARLAANANAYNAAARAVNAAVRDSDGVLPAAQTGAAVHALAGQVASAAADQRDVLYAVSESRLG